MEESAPSIPDLEGRIRKLDQALTRCWMVAAAGVIGVAMLMFGFDRLKKSTSARVVGEAQELRVSSSSGELRARLAIASDGEPFLEMKARSGASLRLDFGWDGAPRLLMTAAGGARSTEMTAAHLNLDGGKTGGAVALSVWDDGVPQIDLQGPAGDNAAVVLAVGKDGDPFLSLRDARHAPRAELGLHGGVARLLYYDIADRPVAAWRLDRNGKLTNTVDGDPEWLKPHDQPTYHHKNR